MTEVNKDIDILKSVQVLDKEIYDLEVFLEGLPERLEELDNEFELKKQTFNELDEKVIQLKLKIKEEELDLGKKDDEMTKLDGQLVQLKTNKEYAAMLEQISSIKADKAMVEEALLGEWDKVEELNQEKNIEKKKLDEEEAKLKQQKQGLEKEASEAKVKIESLQKERLKNLEPIEKEVKELYDKILKKREGVAMASITGDICGACHVQLRPQIINEVKLQRDVVCCENCTRILFEN